LRSRPIKLKSTCINDYYPLTSEFPPPLGKVIDSRSGCFIRERKNPIGKDDSLASRLLQLSTSAVAVNIRQHLASLLFEVSNSNPEEFVRNVGYGYASGLLLSVGAQLPQSVLEDLSTSSDSSGRIFNPVTGQALDSEPQIKDPFSEMTDEEKEREAERLFVLFERYKQLIPVGL